MIDERAELERAIRRFRPDPGIVERVLERRRRQQRNSRIAAAIVAVVIVAVTVGGAVAVLRPRTVPVHEPPVGAVQMHNGPIDVFGFIGGIRAIGTDGFGAFVVRCGGACTEIAGASWSPDGTRLAFDAECAGACGTIGHPYHGIRILTQDGDRLILPTEGVGPLAWSPDGTRIAFATDWDYSPESPHVCTRRWGLGHERRRLRCRGADARVEPQLDLLVTGRLPARVRGPWRGVHPRPRRLGAGPTRPR